ncbi:MAG: class I SAM-dependent methyltransferase [Chloroflexi bacterium]|nr:class I SAM-dependent methyltransferase [Chloroflexota bacterium]
MPGPEHYNTVRYLKAKAAVDDDALNARVYDALAHGISDMGGKPLRVIELGAGVGSTFRRLFERGLLSSGEYTMVDHDSESLEEASRAANAILDSSGGTELSVNPVVGDAVAYLQGEAEAGRLADVIIAQALVDLLNVPEFLGAAANALRPGGLLYLPITFDGETVFEPTANAVLNARVFDSYHRAMDDRRTPNGLPTGGRKAGRTLLTEIPQAGLEIAAAGSSDWVVYPQDGGYPEDVAYFLHHIINFVWETLSENAVVFSAGLEEWVAGRHRQVELGELIYIAHQLDVLARKPG